MNIKKILQFTEEITDSLNNALYIHRRVLENCDFAVVQPIWYPKSTIQNYTKALITFVKKFFFACQGNQKSNISKVGEVLLYVNSANTYDSLKFLLNMQNVTMLTQIKVCL